MYVTTGRYNFQHVFVGFNFEKYYEHVYIDGVFKFFLCRGNEFTHKPYRTRNGKEYPLKPLTGHNQAGTLSD